MFGTFNSFVTGFVAGLIKSNRVHVEVDSELMAVTIRGWSVSDRQAWPLLAGPLSYGLSALAQSEDNPAVSYRNYHCVTAAIMRPHVSQRRSPFGDLTILIGGNVTPYSGVQRRCAERQVAFRGMYLGLSPIGCVTGNLPQPDDTTGLKSPTGVLYTCCDCRAELPEVFGWPPQLPMRFFKLDDPTIHEDISFGKILERFAPHDERRPRKAVLRAA